MAGGGGGVEKSLDQTPTWAVALVCAIIVIISLLLEHALHAIAHTLKKKKKEPMLEALEKIKTELMVLGFISLILTFGQSYIIRICIPEWISYTMLPCKRIYKKTDTALTANHHPSQHQHQHQRQHQQRHLLLSLSRQRRFLAGAKSSACDPGKAPLISIEGLHQLHIFIFFLAVFHVLYTAITMLLGRMRIRGWKEWEREAVENDAIREAQQFRLTHETSFVKDHLSVWNNTKVLFYFACFFRQFFRAIRKADYLSMRQGFISVHLAPGSKFNFQKYIKRSLEDDFKVVVGISPVLWTSAVLFLFVNVDGWNVMLALSFMPLVVTLAVGTKLQAIITTMAMEIKERHAVVQGIPLVQVSDRHFWFSWPRLILHLIHLTLFQNAFEIIFFLWTWYEFKWDNCFFNSKLLLAARMALGVAVQILCSYVTLPLYALVTQMGSTMKRTIFDDQTSNALRNWHKKIINKKNTDGKPEPIATKKLGATGKEGEAPPPPPKADTQSTTPPALACTEASIDIETPGGGGDDSSKLGSGTRDLLTGP